MLKPKILIFIGHYLPGYKAGGPVRSLTNIIELLKDNFTFGIVTSDRDLGDNKPYKNIVVDTWSDVNSNKVYYCSPKTLTIFKLRALIQSSDFDVIYLNSFFDFRFSILIQVLWLFRLIPRKLIILAPRGEFSPGAFKIKSIKKKLYLYIYLISQIHKKICWHASSEIEKKDIINILGNNLSIKISENIPPLSTTHKSVDELKTSKRKGAIKIVFLSRISKKKNLIFALNVLEHVIGNITFDIYGPIEDKTYWEQCLNLIKRLPGNIRVNKFGSIEHENVINTFKQYDLFFFPTLGENYGHVIIESLLAGCPVLISDRTIWQSLSSKKIGWDISLDDFQKFVFTLQNAIDMDRNEFFTLKVNAFNFAVNYINNSDYKEQYKALFTL